MPTDESALLDDLAELCRLVGLPDCARPNSPHEVFQKCLALLKVSSTIKKRAIFDRIEERIAATPNSGINAEGVYSEHVHSSQRAYLDGLRAGRMAAINALCG